MVRRYSIQEAQGYLPGIVEEAEDGTRIELTREGRPVALLLRLPVEAQPAAPDKPGDFWAAYEEFRRTHDLTSDPIDPDEIFVREARLSKLGRIVPFVDGQIAAVAAVHGLVLVTSNRTDFEPFEGLEIQDWKA